MGSRPCRTRAGLEGRSHPGAGAKNMYAARGRDLVIHTIFSANDAPCVWL